MPAWDNRLKSGYVGCCYHEGEFALFSELLKQHGIAVERIGRYSTMGITISIYCAPSDAPRAREIRRGFKAGLLVRGDPSDFLLGIRAALRVRAKSKRLLPAPRPALGGWLK